MRNLWIALSAVVALGAVLGRRVKQRHALRAQRGRRFSEAEVQRLWHAVHHPNPEARAAWKKLIEASKEVVKID